MTADLILPDLSTPEAFAAWVERQPTKYEMAGGRLVMMAGGTSPHSLIAANVIAALRPRLRGSRCRTYTSDFLVVIGPTDRYTPTSASPTAVTGVSTPTSPGWWWRSWQRAPSAST